MSAKLSETRESQKDRKELARGCVECPLSRYKRLVWRIVEHLDELLEYYVVPPRTPSAVLPLALETLTLIYLYSAGTQAKVKRDTRTRCIQP
jgi:hypothetical protein